jgi:hypothetical protein
MSLASATPMQSVLILGGPDAGKTNYVLRLWLAISNGRSRLASAGLPADLEYLNDSSNNLLRGRFAPHTPHGVRTRSIIPIKLDGDGAFKGSLVIPDYSGEEFDAAYHSREWTNDWEDQIDANCGCLLFIRVDSSQMVTKLDWIAAGRIWAEGGPPLIGGAQKEGVPTQVMLVDWLQFLRRAYMDRVGGGFRPRVGIVISAWDAVPGDQQAYEPEHYVAENFPLLAQYVDSNSDSFEFRAFGLSVVGGDLQNEPGFRETFMKDPLASGYVVMSSEKGVIKHADIGIPVIWALGARIA